MTPEKIELASRLLPIFFPHAVRVRGDMVRGKQRFVHYTSAANALNIINTKRLWMRNATCMTDYSEIQHGYQVLNRYFSNEAKKQVLFEVLDECNAGVGQDAVNLFNQWWQSIQMQTYIASISEHHDGEDLHGRLSMWRAFGGDTTARVAFVFNISLEIGSNSGLNAVLHPVAYFTDQECDAELRAVAENIRANRDFLCRLDRPILVGTIFAMLATSTVCMKHEGFHEEREWRVIYSPKRQPSTLMEESVEVIGGIPQIIYKIPLEDRPTEGVSLALPTLFDRLIIGPSPFPWVLYEAFVAALEHAGVKNAASRVLVSQIPIRT
jgi:hypothetical protein